MRLTRALHWEATAGATSSHHRGNSLFARGTKSTNSVEPPKWCARRVSSIQTNFSRFLTQVFGRSWPDGPTETIYWVALGSVSLVGSPRR